MGGCRLIPSTSLEVHSRLDHVFTISLIRNPALVRNQSVIVKPRYFYSWRCHIFDIDIFVEAIL